MEQTLGKRIMAHRKHLGLTQDALAEQLGVTAQAVSKWENDQSCPDIGMLPKLASIFGTTTDELLGIERKEEVKTGEVVDYPQEESGEHSARGNFEFNWEAGSGGTMTFAVLVLLVGGLMLASRLLNWNAGFWSILWPSALLVYGTRYLFSRFTFLRLSAALVGAYCLCVNINVWHFDFGAELILPVLLLLFGISLVIDALRRPRRPKTSVHCPPGHRKSTHHKRIDGENFECDASFCEDIQHIRMPLLRSGKAALSFGELTLDLSGVEEVAEDCDLKLSCSFGEMTVKVPKKYRVVTRGNNFFAGTTIRGECDEETRGTIYADASCSFGEITIRYI